MIITLESICDETVRFARKILFSNKAYIVPMVAVKYDDFCTIAAALVSSAAILEKNPTGKLVLPISMTQLYMSEYYDLATCLMDALGLCDEEQFVVCIDADENAALAEHFENDIGTFFTLEELSIMRRELNTSYHDFRILGKAPRFFHITKGDVYSKHVYQSDIYRHIVY
ncbi:hypothetical protein ATCVCan0610SP_542R [Acanthocystis turfacea Chlorella virus Can0610SP]|nr:hypothetical protein ATCVCan0610SP_542R [Acanthocystis turfacea Chlorella virus Can0610SP]